MLQSLQSLFDSFVSASTSPAPADREHALQLGTAVLLVEVMRAEPQIQPAERRAVLDALRAKFALGDAELERLVALAEQEAQGLYDYHRFTSRMNEHFTQAQKIRVIEAMWEVAYSDAHLDAHENHLISKMAGLLHVTHGEYIAAKMRAKEAAGHH